MKTTGPAELYHDTIVGKATIAVHDLLLVLPFAEATFLPEFGIESNIQCDFAFCLKLSGRERLVIGEVKSNGEPRIARNAVNQLIRARGKYPDSYGLFIAPYVSEQAAAICAEENIGYLDLAGNCRFVLDTIYIERMGKPNPYIKERGLQTLYSPKAERVLRALLIDPKRLWQVQELAATAQVSLGQAHNVKQILENREWLRKEQGSGKFLLTDPGALLTEWAAQDRRKRSAAQDFYSLLPLHESEGRLAELCQEAKIPFALTELSGAARYASYARYQRLSAYVEGNPVDLVAQLGWKPAVGGNVRLLTPYDDGVFLGAQNVDDIPIVSPIQVYLDLQGTQSRGQEAAQFLREEVIEPRWK